MWLCSPILQSFHAGPVHPNSWATPHEDKNSFGSLTSIIRWGLELVCCPGMLHGHWSTVSKHFSFSRNGLPYRHPGSCLSLPASEFLFGLGTASQTLVCFAGPLLNIFSWELRASFSPSGFLWGPAMSTLISQCLDATAHLSSNTSCLLDISHSGALPTKVDPLNTDRGPTPVWYHHTCWDLYLLPRQCFW